MFRAVEAGGQLEADENGVRKFGVQSNDGGEGLQSARHLEEIWRAEPETLVDGAEAQDADRDPRRVNEAAINIVLVEIAHVSHEGSAPAGYFALADVAELKVSFERKAVALLIA